MINDMVVDDPVDPEPSTSAGPSYNPRIPEPPPSSPTYTTIADRVKARTGTNRRNTEAARFQALLERLYPFKFDALDKGKGKGKSTKGQKRLKKWSAAGIDVDPSDNYKL